MLEIKFDSPCESLEIVCISDVHIGNPLCNEAELKRIIDYVLEEPEDEKMGRICLLNGDLTESQTKTNRNSSMFDNAMSPSVQVATMINYLKPLTEVSDKYPQGKILSYCSGNHDFGRYKETGISAAESIAVGLGLEDRFSNDGCYCFIHLKRMNNKDHRRYTLYNQHMSGGGSSVGGKANRVAKISNGVIADIIVGGHVHTPMTFKEDIILPINNPIPKLQQLTITYVVCGAFLRYGDYAQRSGMKPSTIQVPRIFMWQERKQKGFERGRFRCIEVIL